MAKYSLNRTNAVHCSILDENCLANTYTVKFDNGVIKNVPKTRISNLDRIDEGVLDRLKEVGSNLLDNLVKAGRYVFCKLKGGLMATSLINVMIKAEEKPGMQFYPAESFAERCDAAGVEATVTEDDIPEDEEYLDAMNDYWMEKIGMQNESYKVSSYQSRRANRLMEAEDIKIAMGDEGFDNVDVKELQKMIINQYREFLFDGVGKKGADTPIPFCIWGAPGIGKTQIVNQLVKNFQKNGFDANMIVVNAMTMRKDDFTLPGVRTVTRKVKTAKGDDIEFSGQSAIEMPKDWLPMYNPEDATDEITEDMLDDLMNGGDGTGNGVGGFIFIDELSRVSEDVMDVLMQFVQSRTLGRRRLGSKWMIIAAANRLSDMKDKGDMVHWESAYTGRFSHVNFVPTFEDWIIWAQGKREDGKPRIHPQIVSFLKEHPNFWYSAAAGNEYGDEIVDTMYPQARSWENVSKEWYEQEDSAKSYNDDTDAANAFMKMAYDAVGIKGSKRNELNPHEAARIVRHHAGNTPAKAFAAWSGFDARYTDDMAREVWEKGEDAPINFNVSAATIEKALAKVLANHPDYTGSKAQKIDITPDQMVNIIKFLIACANKLDGGTGDTKTQILQAGYATLVTLLRNAPFKINLADQASKAMDKYEDAIDLFGEEVSAAKNAAVNGYEE